MIAKQTKITFDKITLCIHSSPSQAQDHNTGSERRPLFDAFGPIEKARPDSRQHLHFSAIFALLSAHFGGESDSLSEH